MTRTISSAGVDSVLKHFDELSDSQWVDEKVVAAIFGVSVFTVKRRVKEGRLPAPVSQDVCKYPRFRVGELRAVQNRPFKAQPFAFDAPSAGWGSGVFAHVAEFAAIAGEPA